MVGLGPLRDVCLRKCTVVEHVFSSVEFRLASSAELLGFSVRSRGGKITGGRSLRGGNGGGDVPSLGGSIGAFGACLACASSYRNSTSQATPHSSYISTFHWYIHAMPYLTI